MIYKEIKLDVDLSAIYNVNQSWESIGLTLVLSKIFLQISYRVTG